MHMRCFGLIGSLLLVGLSGCSSKPGVDLSTALNGIDKPTFLRCSGPPILSQSQGGKDTMSFVTNLKRGSTIGTSSPTDLPAQSCSVDAVFQNDRLISSTFSGSASMCSLVFAPCVPK